MDFVNKITRQRKRRLNKIKAPQKKIFEEIWDAIDVIETACTLKAKVVNSLGVDLRILIRALKQITSEIAVLESQVDAIISKPGMAITFLDGEDPYTKKDRAEEE